MLTKIIISYSDRISVFYSLQLYKYFAKGLTVLESILKLFGKTI